MRRAALVTSVLLLATAISAAAEPASRPTTGPATRPRRVATTATTQVTVTADAQPWFDKLAAFYAKPGPLRVEGVLTGHFDVAGRAKDYSLAIVGQVDDAGRFRHDTDAGLLINTGSAAYLYDRKRDAYAELTTAPGRQAIEAISPTFIGILVDENPAVLLKHAADPAALLGQLGKSIRLAPSAATQPADVKAAAGLVFEQQDRLQTLWLSDAGEIVAATIDYSPMMRSRKANAIKAALATLVYRSSEVKIPDAGIFNWQPPATAMQFDAEPDLMRPATTQSATRAATTPRRP
ncbi:MAG: hypothetical protein QM754_09825 [Tepidisphaeraceae bacterium]